MAEAAEAAEGSGGGGTDGGGPGRAALLAAVVDAFLEKLLAAGRCGAAGRLGVGGGRRGLRSAVTPRPAAARPAVTNASLTATAASTERSLM